ncbi:MAG: hypothetical protein IJ697_03915 [Synergistaceae bacterium]|nr:hypothetical protein [Synergistaceae bacterium]
MMRKFLLLAAVLAFTAGVSFADGIPPYVVIGNAESISGGNDYVYVSENEGANLDGSPMPDITVTGRERSRLPVSRGSVPTRANSLLNPDEPVEITAKERTIAISDWGGDDVYSVRLFDSKGELVEVNSEEDSRKFPVTVNLASKPEDYYIEFMQRDAQNEDAETEFCYVLVRVRTKDSSEAPVINSKPKNSRLGNPMEAIGEIYRRYRKEAEENPY